LSGLRDVPVDRNRAVGGLILLGELSLTVECRGTDLDGRTVGVEAPQLFGGGEIAGLVELLLELGLEVEHRGAEWHSDLDCKALGGRLDDLGGHRLTS
jgi:hypothetical protein